MNNYEKESVAGAKEEKKVLLVQRRTVDPSFLLLGALTLNFLFP
jgi:hypothetical protein